MAEEKSNYIKLLEEEREASLQKKARVTTSYFVFFFCLNSPMGEIKYLRNLNSYKHRRRILTHCNSSLQIEKLEKSNENLKLSRKKVQEAHAKV